MALINLYMDVGLGFKNPQYRYECQYSSGCVRLVGPISNRALGRKICTYNKNATVLVQTKKVKVYITNSYIK